MFFTWGCGAGEEQKNDSVTVSFSQRSLNYIFCAYGLPDASVIAFLFVLKKLSASKTWKHPEYSVGEGFQH